MVPPGQFYSKLHFTSKVLEMDLDVLIRHFDIIPLNNKILYTPRLCVYGLGLKSRLLVILYHNLCVDWYDFYQYLFFGDSRDE